MDVVPRKPLFSRRPRCTPGARNSTTETGLCAGRVVRAGAEGEGPRGPPTSGATWLSTRSAEGKPPSLSGRCRWTNPDGHDLRCRRGRRPGGHAWCHQASVRPAAAPLPLGVCGNVGLDVELQCSMRVGAQPGRPGERRQLDPEEPRRPPAQQAFPVFPRPDYV